MNKESRVLIVEDDPFSQNWMALLLARDWRTRVVGEVGSLAEMQASLTQARERPNFVLLDAGLLRQAGESALAHLTGSPRVLLIDHTPRPDAYNYLPIPGFCGWILKSEIRYGLGWAIALADPQQWVVTPGMEQRLPLQPHELVLDGRKSVYNLTDHEAEVARMALIFSMERRELSDELKISADWSYGLVSSIYRKLGMEEIISGEVDPEDFLGRQFSQNARFKEMLSQAGKNRKKNDLESMAFHLLTMPEIREIDEG